MLVGDILHNSAIRAPDRVALIGRGKRLTYVEFEESANRLANALIDLKLDKGAKVAILSTNRAEYAIAYFAIARTPYISAHCSTRSVASELAYVLNRIEVEVLILEAGFVAAIRELPRRAAMTTCFDPATATATSPPDAKPPSGRPTPKPSPTSPAAMASGQGRK